jgi:hypothetical protein
VEGVFRSFEALHVPHDPELVKRLQKNVLARHRWRVAFNRADPAPPAWIRMTPRGAANHDPVNARAVERVNAGSFVCGPHICDWCAHAFTFVDNVSLVPKKKPASRNATVETAGRKMLKKAVSCAHHGKKTTWFGREQNGRVVLGDRATHTYVQKTFSPTEFVDWMTRRYRAATSSTPTARETR